MTDSLTVCRRRPTPVRRRGSRLHAWPRRRLARGGDSRAVRSPSHAPCRLQAIEGVKERVSEGQYLELYNAVRKAE